MLVIQFLEMVCSEHFSNSNLAMLDFYGFNFHWLPERLPDQPLYLVKQPCLQLCSPIMDYIANKMSAAMQSDYGLNSQPNVCN